MDEQYLSMFIDESQEHLQALNENMMRLEEQPEEIEIVQIIFRSAHTLKGMAATMGFDDMAKLTHQMENVLDLVRQKQLVMHEGIFDCLFKSVDALTGMLQDIIDGGEGNADVEELIQKLNQVGSSHQEIAASAATVATPTTSASNLDQYQRSIVEQSISTGMKAYEIQIKLADTCLLKGVRAYMIFNALEPHGEIIGSNPAAQEIEQEHFDLSFSLYYVTSLKEDELHKILDQISEVSNISIFSLDPNSSVSKVEKPQEKKEETKKNANQTATSTKANNSRTIRVDTERLDSLMNLFSELLIDRVRLEQLAKEIGNVQLTETIEHMTRISNDLQGLVMNIRMVPIETVFNRFPRMVRDVSKSLNKKIDFQISGAQTELDRTVVEEIGDPLVHLLRNSVDHGVEPLEKRMQSGKSEVGMIHLRAFQRGNHVFIEIEDDGQGINTEKVKQIAIEKGLISEEKSKMMKEEEIHLLIFASGFSTADQVSDLSGRGVGLDVVKSKIESLGGQVFIDSKPNKGTIFTIQLPLTLSIISAMLIQMGSEQYAVPLNLLVETQIIDRAQFQYVQKRCMIQYRDMIIPVVSLSEYLECPDYSEKNEGSVEALILRAKDTYVCVLVDEFIGQSEVVLKSLGKYLNQVPGFSGATILGNGQVALILDPHALLK